MVYVYAKLSELNKYIKKDLTTEEIDETLKDMGMDVKGISQDKDPELKIEITSEKIDMVSIVGIARAIRHYREITREIEHYDLIEGKQKVIVDKSVDEVRPKTVAAILRDVPMTQELLDEMIEVQEKIHMSFGRNRKKAAIGIYPIDEIKFPIHYRALKPNEIKFHPLEASKAMTGEEILRDHPTGKTYAHLLEGKKVYSIFEDDKGDILSMPPIINSNKTGRVTCEHKDLFIECSGHNLTHLDNVLKVLVTTFIEMGAKAESMEVVYSNAENYRLDLSNRIETTSIDYINKLIGINVDEKQIGTLLNKVMYKLKSVDKEGNIEVEIPAYRCDVWYDADIADDVARAYGYNNIELTFPNIATIGKNLDYSQFKDRLSQTMVSLGFTELYTYILSSTENQFKNMNLKEGDFKFLRLIDVEDQGINMLRINILPENLESLRINRKNKYPQKVFENGFCILEDNTKDTRAKNQSKLSVSIADPKSNYTQIKEVLETLFKLNEIEYELKTSDLSYLIKGRRADVCVNGKNVGFIGEVAPEILSNFSLIVPVSSFEIDLDLIYDN